MSTITQNHAIRGPFISKEILRRVGPFGCIVLLHVAILVALQSGLLPSIVPKVVSTPHEVSVSFITPEVPAITPTPQPAPPKVVPVVKKVVALPVARPVPLNNPTPQSITVPPVAPSPDKSPVDVAPPVESAPPVASAPPSAPAELKTVSSGVEYIRPPEPEYPLISKRMHEEGKTVLRVLVSESGHPERAEIKKSSGSPRLDEAARQAAMGALFKPYIEDGKAIAVLALVPIRFQLDR